MLTHGLLVECPECQKHLVIKDSPMVLSCINDDAAKDKKKDTDTDFMGLGAVLGCIGTVLAFVFIL